MNDDGDDECTEGTGTGPVKSFQFLHQIKGIDLAGNLFSRISKLCYNSLHWKTLMSRIIVFVILISKSTSIIKGIAFT